MKTITTIDRGTAKAELVEAFPTFRSEGQDEHWFYNNEDNKFGLAGNCILVEFCECRTLGVFRGKLEILNPDYEHSDPEDEDDIEPWLTICKGDPHSTLAEAIASLKESISSHAKAIALVQPVE